MARVPSLSDFPPTLTREAFWGLLGQVEHEQLDFKRGVSTSIRETISAMAMTHGGLIVHGIDDQRSIVGCPLSQNTQDRISRIATECGVDVQVRTVVVGPHELTITAVPEVRGRIVTTPDGRLLRRVGGDSQPIRGDAMARFVREREYRSGEDEPLALVRPETFSLEALNQALAADGRGHAGPTQLTRALTDLNVAVAAPPPLGSNVLQAAAILFASQPRDLIRGAAVQLVRCVGVGPQPGPATAREECSAPLVATVDCCLKFIADHTRGVEAVSGSRREVLPEYPQAVLREAIVNALAHRDYGLRGSTVDISVWDDRVEIHSPGPLPGHITLENMRTEHYSRNPRIMRVLKTVGLVEEYGEGIERMYREMESRLLDPPAFSATNSSVTVTLYNRCVIDVEEQLWLQALEGAHLTADERRLLVEVRRAGGSIAPRQVREAIPGADTRELLARTQAKGLLARIGKRGGSRYALANFIVPLAGGSVTTHAQMLLDEIRRQGSLSTPEGVKLIGIAPGAVRAVLNKLEQAGLIRAEGKTRARRYYLR